MTIAVMDAVHKLQLHLLEGIKKENQLFAAGSLLSRGDYQDVVIERTLADVCGYPLCSNCLPSERPRKGRYRISLKEHKVYDLQEAYMYCSSTCLINSRAFAASLQEEISSTLNTANLNQVLKLFEGLNVESSVNMGKNEDLGLSGLTIQEKTDREAGEVSVEEWIGPSNAIDGYVPQRDRHIDTHRLNIDKKRSKQGKIESKHRHVQPNVPDILSYDMNFTSTILTEDEYTISKTVPPVKGKESKEKMSCKDIKKLQNDTTTDDKVSALEDTGNPSPDDNAKADKKLHLGKKSAAGATVTKKSPRKISDSKKAGATILKSSLKTSDSTKATCSVTWADENSDVDGQNLHECRELRDEKGSMVAPHSAVDGVGEESDRFASAEACARALSQAAEVVASGNSDASDAAGVIILPPGQGVDEPKSDENGDVLDTDPLQLKWPPKPGFASSDLFDSDDSWYDSPPGGFNLTGRLLDTMSFVDPLPAFRMKQWQVILLLFLDALSMSRIPALTPYMLDRRILLPKVLKGAQISSEEFEIMKDLIIPLPQFSAQSGGLV